MSDILNFKVTFALLLFILIYSIGMFAFFGEELSLPLTTYFSNSESYPNLPNSIIDLPFFLIDIVVFCFTTLFLLIGFIANIFLFNIEGMDIVARVICIFPYWCAVIILVINILSNIMSNVPIPFTLIFQYYDK